MLPTHLWEKQISYPFILGSRWTFVAQEVYENQDKYINFITSCVSPDADESHDETSAALTHPCACEKLMEETEPSRWGKPWGKGAESSVSAAAASLSVSGGNGLRWREWDQGLTPKDRRCEKFTVQPQESRWLFWAAGLLWMLSVRVALSGPGGVDAAGCFCYIYNSLMEGGNVQNKTHPLSSHSYLLFSPSFLFNFIPCHTPCAIYCYSLLILSVVTGSWESWFILVHVAQYTNSCVTFVH